MGTLSADSARAYFAVERSLTGKRWREREADLALVEAHRRRLGLPEIAARLLAARKVSEADAPAFLSPTLRTFFPDPSSFADMDEAARVIEDALSSGRPTAVFADYDVDGGTSAAQLVRYFRARGRTLRVYVPDRMSEGYGPNAAAFETLKSEGIDLVITVDCGAAAYEPLKAAAALGLEVVVIDHHLMGSAFPPARALVNPNRPDCPSGQGHLTAAGVVLVTLAAVNREARRRGRNDLPDLMELLDLSALGTVCDVAPLTGFNRAVVAQGLKKLREGKNVGLAALGSAAGRKSLGEVYDLGFVLGPRLNAGGRIGDATLAARLLSTDDPAEAADLAAQLDALNAERRRQEQDILSAAARQAEADPDRPVLVVGDPGWHPGVIGIVAGRLKERLMKPVIVLGGGGGGEPGKGSGRSVTGVNLGRAVGAAAAEGILIAGGGHAMAAGLTIAWERVPAFQDFLAERLRGEVAAAEGEARTLWLDATAAPRALNLNLLEAVDRIGPYGPGHPEPVFALAEVRASYAAAIKEEHVRCVLEAPGAGRVRAIAFRAMASGLGPALLSGQPLHAAVRLKRNAFNGSEQAQAEIVDAAPAG